jgi:hypothetical protein
VIAYSLNVAGTHIIRSGSLSLGTSKLNNLAIAQSAGTFTGLLNLQNNRLIIQSADPTEQAAKVPALFAAIASGRANNTWTGKGLTSATAAANPQHLTLAVFNNADLHLTTFGGLAVDENSLLISVAPIADTNLDSRVDAFDLNTLAAHWQQQAGATASSGDFDHDGKVDAFDLNLLAANWQFGAGSLGALREGVRGSAGGGCVPEPATLGMLLVGASLAFRRRRIF